jgi:hypothetical protein
MRIRHPAIRRRPWFESSARVGSQVCASPVYTMTGSAGGLASCKVSFVPLAKVSGSTKLMRQVRLAIHRPGGGVPAQRQDDAAVVAEASPGQAVADHPQLPGHPLVDVSRQFPAFGRARIAAVRWRRRILRSPTAAPESLDHPGALTPAFFDLVEVAEQAALQLVEVARLLTSAKVADKLGDPAEAGPAGLGDS